MLKRSIVIKLVSAFSVLTICGHNKVLAIEAIELSGLIRTELIAKILFPHLPEESTNTFKSLVAGDKWIITIYPETKVYEYESIAYDGTNSYWYVQFLKHSSNNVANSSAGSISKRNTPPFPSMGIPQVAWLATASYTYFDHEEPGFALDVWTIGRHETKNKKNKIVIHRHINNPFLPEYIEFYNDGVNYMMEITTQKYISKPYPAPFDKGFVVAIYSATNYFSVNGLWFPREFEFRRIMLNMTKMDLEELSICRGIIQNHRVCTVTDSDFIPRTDGATHVTDERFADIDLPSGITYISTNQDGRWLAKESPSLKRIAQHQREMRSLINRKPPHVAGGKKVVMFIMMISVAIIPLVWHLYKRLGEKSRQE